ncbi:hypothetical protein BpHYR1_019112 [Brachionus plicatilis]|uniref:Uncharacterized protein n=1 Tax=Brachionus plicatilis TaxID=10195 RepID=A0A3M7SCZ2_BRAPC|nr:hypothetical protein BpHYR1_019112 [Brachionus plicatilis]
MHLIVFGKITRSCLYSINSKLFEGSLIGNLQYELIPFEFCFSSTCLTEIITYLFIWIKKKEYLFLLRLDLN